MMKIKITYFFHSLALHLVALSIIWTIPVNKIYPSVNQMESNIVDSKKRDKKIVEAQGRNTGSELNHHTIKKGDSLSKIAGRLFNDPLRWTELWKINPHIKNPNILYVGDVIEITKATKLKNSNFSTIKKGDTLSKIAGRLFNDPRRWRELWKLNPHIKDPDLIYEGDLLKTKRHLIEKPSKDPIIKLTKHLEAPGFNAASEVADDAIGNDDEVITVFLYDRQIMPDLPVEREDAAGENLDKAPDKPVRKPHTKSAETRPVKTDEKQDKGPLVFTKNPLGTTKESDTVYEVSQDKGPELQGGNKEDREVEIKETLLVAFKKMESSTVMTGKAIARDADGVTISGIPEIEESTGIVETVLTEEEKGDEEWVPLYPDTEQQKSTTPVTMAAAEETVIKKGSEKVEQEEKPLPVQQARSEYRGETARTREVVVAVEALFVSEPREQVEAPVKEVEGIAPRALSAGTKEPVVNKIEIEKSAAIAEIILIKEEERSQAEPILSEVKKGEFAGEEESRSEESVVLHAVQVAVAQPDEVSETKGDKEWEPMYFDTEQKSAAPLLVVEAEETQLKATYEKVEEEENPAPIQQTRNESRGEAARTRKVEVVEAFVTEPMEQVEAPVKEVDGVAPRTLSAGAEEPVVKEIEIEEPAISAEILMAEEGKSTMETLLSEAKKEETVKIDERKNVKKIESYEENMIAEIQTSEKNSTPSRKEYLNSLAEEENREAKPELKGEVVLPADIEIRVDRQGSKYSGISYHFLKKAHPMVRGRRQREDAMMEEFREAENEVSNKRVFSFAMSEKGGYTFRVANSGKEAQRIDLLFRLYGGRIDERIREFRGIQVEPKETVMFKFILPEAVFWDDDDYFTGMIEGSDSITKFNEDTGLVWKEKK